VMKRLQLPQTKLRCNRLPIFRRRKQFTHPLLRQSPPAQQQRQPELPPRPVAVSEVPAGAAAPMSSLPAANRSGSLPDGSRTRSDSSNLLAPSAWR